MGASWKQVGEYETKCKSTYKALDCTFKNARKLNLDNIYALGLNTQANLLFLVRSWKSVRIGYFDEVCRIDTLHMMIHQLLFLVENQSPSAEQSFDIRANNG